MRAFMRHCLTLGVLAFALAGCIVVDDFGDAWSKGFIDNCVNELALTDNEYNRPHSPHAKGMVMRSLRVGNHTFLMIREHMRDKGGNMIRYKIDSGDYVAYRLNESKREDFAKEYPDSSVVLTSETATIPVLDSKSTAMLSRVADDESYWVESRRVPYNPGHRDDCIQTLY